MDGLYQNPFVTYRKTPDNYYSSALPDYSTQESSTLGTSFCPNNRGAMATTDIFRPSDPPSSPPSQNGTSCSRFNSPQNGLAMSLQSHSTPSRLAPDDRATPASLGSAFSQQPTVNATSSYSAPRYSGRSEMGKGRLGGESEGLRCMNDQDWKRSPHAEIKGGAALDPALGEHSFSSHSRELSGLGLEYPEEDGRASSSSLSGALSGSGGRGDHAFRNGPSYLQASPTSQNFTSPSFATQSPFRRQAANGGSEVGDISDVSAGSSRGSGKRASGLPIETDTSFGSSNSSHLQQAQNSPATTLDSISSRISDQEPIKVHTFFPDNGEAGIPVTIIATLSSQWAASLGLDPSESSSRYQSPRGKLLVAFGNENVEAKVERSFNPDDGRSETNFNVNITVSAPSFANTQWTSTRVPIFVNLHGLDSNQCEIALPGDGKEIGEFLYWLVSPRSALKRFGEPLEDESRLENPANQSSAALRRPASFPALTGFSSDATEPLSSVADPESYPNSYGRIPGTTLNRSISHNKGIPAAQSFNPSLHAMRQYRSDMGLSQSSPSQSQSSFGTGPTASPGVGSDRISGDFTFSAGRPSSINLPQTCFAGMGISGPSGAASPDGLSRHDFSADSDSRPMTANSVGMHSPALSMDDRQLSHSSSINSLNTSFSSMRRGSAGYSPALPGSSTFSSNSSSAVQARPTPPPTSIPSSSKYPKTEVDAGAPPSATVKAGSRAALQMHGDLQDMAVGWSHDEYMNSRRLVQFWRRQDGITIHMTFRPILPEQYVPNSIVISCIFREDKNECFITSVDLIYLLEALVASRFTIEEKNRIRRNLEGFKPSTVAKKGKDDSPAFFKTIMNFPNPKPRNIEKDVKVFPWSVLGRALSKIIGKYSAAPPNEPKRPLTFGPASPAGPQQHQHQPLSSNFSPSPSTGSQTHFNPSPRSASGPAQASHFGNYYGASQSLSMGDAAPSASSGPTPGHSSSNSTRYQDSAHQRYEDRLKDESSGYPSGY